MSDNAKTELIMLVEDDTRVMALNERKLSRRGYRTVKAYSLAEARKLLQTHKPDILVMDVMLPDGSGVDFCAEYRKFADTPVLFLSGKAQVDDRVAGLSAGGDYYLTKPYDYDELVAVVESLLRRKETAEQATASAAPEVTKFGPLVLDSVAARAQVNGEDIMLTPKEFALLMRLAQSPGEHVLPEVLYEKVWGMNMGGDDRAVRTQVSRLRKKLEATKLLAIKSDRSSGYLLTAYDFV